MKNFTFVIEFLFFLLLFVACSDADKLTSERSGTASQQEEPIAEVAVEKRPNVLLIVVDDMAFNDLGIFGGEIDTPNIDKLAREGMAFTSFYAAPTCSPTRSMLLSGTDNHIAGLGNMAEELADNQKGRPGYEGYLNFRVAALPELFQDAGYHTYMTGKWHLGLTEQTSPAARGFDRSFIMAQGGAGAFANMLPLFGPDKAIYREDGKKLDSLPEDFYSTRFYTERMIDYIDSHHDDGSPFFSYLAYTSPHWPLQAPEASIAKYKGKYDGGYDELKVRRLRALKDRGLVDEDVTPFPRYKGEPAWDELTEEEKQYQSRVMEVYAAMVDDVDIYIGKIIDHLKAIGEYENTFIFFMSDNGPEAHPLYKSWAGLAEYVQGCCDNSYENIGKANSYIWYGQNWGQAGDTPLRGYKGYTSQGGIRVPAFAHYPKSIRPGVLDNQVLTVMDVMPTLLEVAGINHPDGRYRDRDIVQMQGKSMLSVLQGKADKVHPDDYVIGWELFSKRAIRKGDWKIIYEPYNKVLEPRVAGIKPDTWQLYNLAEDPVEMHDLSAENAEKLAQMVALWQDYARQTSLVIPDSWDGY